MRVLEVGEGVLSVVSHAMMTKKGSASWGVLEEDGEEAVIDSNDEEVD